MPEQRSRDILDAVEASYAERDLARWPVVASRALRRLIPCRVVVYNDVDPERGTIVAVSDPDGFMEPWMYPVWERYGTQNPMLARALAGDVSPYSWDDLMPRADLERLELYQQLYARMGVVDQLSVAVTAPQPQITAFTLNHVEGRFTADDKHLVRALQPHLTRAYDAARVAAGARRDSERVAAALDLAGVAVIVIDPDGYVVEATPPAVAALERAGVPVATGARASDALLAAVEERRVTAGARGVALEVAPRDRETVVVLRGQLGGGAAARVGLTPRELEVLDLAGTGLAPKGIAHHLGVSPRTVHKHLQHAYNKLGVPNLVAALAVLRD